MLKIEFDHFGPIRNGYIRLNNLIIFCGQNNEGKTYASYAMHGLFKTNFHSHFSYFDDFKLTETGRTKVDLNKIIQQYELILARESKELSEELPAIFSTDIESFELSKIKLSLDLKALKKRFIESEFEIEFEVPGMGKGVIKKEFENLEIKIEFIANVRHINAQDFGINVEEALENYIDNFVFQEWISMPFLLPAERSGLNLFYKELNTARNELVHSLGTKSFQNSKGSLNLDFSKEISIYAEPIADYLTFLNSLTNYTKKKGEFEDLAQTIQHEILRGTYEVQNNNIQYLPIKNVNDVYKRSSIGLHVSSSTVKTLFGLVFYLTYMAIPGATLIIDEPELNLHPDNQRKLARILAEATNRGLRVILSTHSDYIVKEFNNLIMLSNDFENKEHIMQKFGYTAEQILEPQNVGAYMFADHTIAEMEVNEREGIIAETFNEVINQYNDSNDEIYYALMENEEHAESD